MMFDILLQFRSELWSGLKVTLLLASIIWTSGLTFGTILGFVAARYHTLVGVPVRVLSSVCFCIPILVWLMWMHYPIQMMLNLVINPFITAAVSLSILNVLWCADLWRGVIADLPKQYISAALVCGLSQREINTSIIVPLLIRHVLPGLLITQISMLHATLFASLISVDEIFRTVQRINSQIYKPVELYTALAILFTICCMPIYILSNKLKLQIGRDLSEQ